ncbi:MAG TPA: hypothetical protein VIG73_06805 [Cerasibacillus sp.]|uniref:hypothetical protein n=1 Tax=Cerasibacillus sp. TaxID=2498711 RepID=UPI002F3E3B26
MKILANFINSLVASIISTLIILTASFMIMLFSSGKEGYRTSYFDSIYFNNVAVSEEILEMQFGVAKGSPIIMTIIILFVVYFLLFSIKKRAKDKA